LASLSFSSVQGHAGARATHTHTSLLFHSFHLTSLQQVRHVGRQLLDLGVVEALDVLEQALVVLGDKVDGDALAAEPTRPADAVQVVLRLGGQVVVDDQGDLGF
jgi:hypothetical protein